MKNIILENTKSSMEDNSKILINSIKKEKTNNICDEKCISGVVDLVISTKYGPQNKGSFFIIDDLGVILAHKDNELVGKNAIDIIREGAFYINEEELYNIPSTNVGFIEYTFKDNNKGNIKEKILYYKYLPKLNIYLCNILVASGKNQILSSISKYTLKIFTILIGLLLATIFITTYIVKKKNILERNESDIMNALPLGIFRLERIGSSEFKVKLGNSSLLKIFGLKIYDLDKIFSFDDCFIGKKIYSLLDDNGGDYNNFRVGELEINTESGGKKYINLGMRTVGIGKNSHVDGWVEDITHRFESKELLENSYKKIKKAEGIKDEIIGITSHELRTPLTIIKGFISILKTDAKSVLTIKQKTYIEKIELNSDKLLSMINNMLDLNKIELYKSDIKIEKIDIKNIIIETYNEFKVKFKISNKKINLNLSKGDLIVNCNSGYFRRILINLIGNAFKFIDNGKGIVDIIVENIDSKYITITIKDNGIGIPKKDIKLIFDKFKQSQSLMEHKEGSGLGLSIVKESLIHMGSKIEVKSIEGKGSEFSFKLYK